MKTYAPSYYQDFHCITSACKHNCCIGWEIDVEPQTYRKYKSLEEADQKYIMENISYAKGVHSLRLDANNRCKFLTDNGLCDLILHFGEEMLCEICREHPRYYLFFVDHTEVGLGLCCEAAATLMLSQTDPESFVCIGEDEAVCKPPNADVRFFTDTRDQLFAIVQNRKESLSTRIQRLTDFCGIKQMNQTVAQWCTFYRKLERLDPIWDQTLAVWEKHGGMSLPDAPSEEIICEQLLYHLIHRHFSEANEDERYHESVFFAIHAVYVISGMVAAYRKEYGDHALADWVEIAGQYSREIEYSLENLGQLYDVLFAHLLTGKLKKPECKFFDIFYVADNPNE